MSVLAKEKILEQIKLGNIKISNFDKKNLGPASYDLKLGNEFRFFTKDNLKKPIKIEDDIDYKDHTTKVVLKKGETFTLKSRETCLAITEETISLSEDFCGLLEGRSRFARMGLFVHITAGFMQPGINNKQVLEIFNANPKDIQLIPGTKICQFVFVNMDGKGKYKGRFSSQEL